jgi:hypothetical protein
LFLIARLCSLSTNIGEWTNFVNKQNSTTTNPKSGSEYCYSDYNKHPRSPSDSSPDIRGIYSVAQHIWQEKKVVKIAAGVSTTG